LDDTPVSLSVKPYFVCNWFHQNVIYTWLSASIKRWKMQRDRFLPLKQKKIILHPLRGL
jgi:hypothetical protein